MKHLTHTGSLAGQPICGTDRQPDGEYFHAVYAPLHNPAVRATICPDCLKTWIDSYDDDEIKPEWAQGANHA